MKKYLVMVAIATVVACGDEDPKTDYSCGEEVSLSADIMPIISVNCAVNTCHMNGENPMLNTASEVIANADRIRVRTTAGTMPPVDLLTADEIQLISCWVEDGAENN